MSTLLTFDDIDCTSVANAGGKGANLAVLTRAGFPVPAGAVVTPEAYRQFIVPLAGIIDRLRGVGESDHAAIQSVSEEVMQRGRALELPADVRAAVNAFLENHRAHAWAVRSSGTAEDTADAAFAGQHDTYLNCIGVEDVSAKVKSCWLSLWSPRAIAYRARLGIDHGDVAMAVVIQEMVPSEVAGVAFSINPVTGDLTQAVINANFGLGESVVSGEGEVDHIVVEKATGRVVEARIAHKSQRVVAAESGTVETHVSDAEATKASLGANAIVALTALLRRVETHYGWPQDIEWGMVGDRLYLLQSRPITTIPPRWTRDESAERFPNPVSPFTWDFVEDGFHQSLNHSFRLMGLPPYSGKWFASFDQFIYGNQNAVELYARRSPVSAKSFEDLQVALPAILERFRWVQGLPAEWHSGLPAYLAQLEAFMAEPIDGYDIAGCWDYIERVNAVGTAYFLPNIAISIGHGVLHRALHTLLLMGTGSEQKAQELASILVRCETMTTRVNQELRALAALAASDPAFAHELREGSSLDILKRHAGTVSEFWKSFRAFLAAHGHRETDFDAWRPTWVEAPEVVLDHVRALLDAPPPRAEEGPPQAQVEAMVMARVPDGMKDVAGAVVRLAREYTALDDLEHYHTTRLTLPMRRGVRALGQRLVAMGIVDDPMDVFFARKKEVAEAVRADDEATWRALGEKIREGKRAHERAMSTTPAWVLGQDPAAPAGDDGSAMKGIPGSPGVAEGTVHIVRGVEDFSAFPKGAILVARTTNPAWTPLFYSAAAVIAESGGPLSHGAVTAREMGIPAVMAVRGVMTTLVNGDRVRVDGTAGTVTRAGPA